MHDEWTTLLDRIGAPPREFWEHELEMPVAGILKKIMQPGFVDHWIAGQPKRLLNLLRRLLMFGGMTPTPAKATAMHGQMALVPFILVHEFLKHKSKSAMVDYAPRLLPEPLLDLCHKVNGEFDPLCLAFALYHHTPSELLTLSCLDKVHRSGFTRMRLLRNIRRPKQELAEFLTPERVATLLEVFDKDRADDRQSELKRILEYDGRQLVFVRRSQRPACILHEKRIVHGFRPEWIILDFMQSGKRLNIASESIGVALEIADRIAAAYFGADCQYGSEKLVTHREQLCRLLGCLRKDQDPELALIEVSLSTSPLKGTPRILIAGPHSISPAMAHFERAVGRLLKGVEEVTSMRVRFRQRRIVVSFERLPEGEFVVRYSDQRLLPLEQQAFEDHLRDAYGIAAISMGKNIKHAA